VVADVNKFVPGTVATAAPASSKTQSSSAATTKAAAVATPAPINSIDFVDYPVSAAGREIAARMTKAKQEVPHYYLTVDIEVCLI
jgi:pyruvate dehydrogenase E2 component (dihydrolipoamide acetyltransferase)